MELSQNDTKILKAVSVLAMVCLHLFDTYAYKGVFSPLVFLFGRPLTVYFGQLSDFCVMGFAFCSGYAHYSAFAATDLKHYYPRRLRALFSLYVNYWIVLLLFCAIGLCTGHGSEIPGSFTAFLGNVTTVHLSYNGAWWYLFTFALLVFSSPLLLGWVQRGKGSIVFLLSGLLYCVAFYVRFYIPAKPWLLYQFGLYGMTAFEYLLGALCCKYQLFAHIRARISRKANALLWALLIGMLFARTLWIPNLVFAPISGVFILFFVWNAKKPHWLEALLLFLSKHSTNIWLTHMFFYLVLFKGLVYRAQYPVLIYLFMLGITVLVSCCINLIYRPIDCLIRGKTA